MRRINAKLTLIGDDDKRTVQIIEFQPIGGLEFVRQLERDLKLAHWDEQFISQFFGFNRANIDTWPQLRNLTSHFVRESPFGPPRDDWDQVCVRHGSLRNLHEPADNILGARRKGYVDLFIVGHLETLGLSGYLKRLMRYRSSWVTPRLWWSKPQTKAHCTLRIDGQSHMPRRLQEKSPSADS
jgi:hypothetical protein